MQLRCEGVLLQTQQDEANVRTRSWNGDGKETNGHGSGTCTARPANTMLASRHSPDTIATSRSQCMQLRCEGVLLQTQQDEANVRTHSWNGDGMLRLGH
jgi:diaminopimelate epimerase